MTNESKVNMIQIADDLLIPSNELIINNNVDIAVANPTQTSTMVNRFRDVRSWGAIRGIDGAKFQKQYQRFLQEAIEIHDAYNNDDEAEVIDAIGDTIVTLINLAKTQGLLAEACLNTAFNVIELRKGITFDGDFVRYGKLSEENQKYCDFAQGNPGSEYFLAEEKHLLTPKSFEPIPVISK